MIPKALAVGLETLSPAQGLTSYGQLVSIVIKNAFVFAGVISFFLLIFGGFQVIVAAGDTKKLESGRGALAGAVVGLLIVVGSYWIIQIIGVVTGLDLLNPPV